MLLKPVGIQSLRTMCHIKRMTALLWYTKEWSVHGGAPCMEPHLGSVPVPDLWRGTYSLSFPE